MQEIPNTNNFLISFGGSAKAIEPSTHEDPVEIPTSCGEKHEERLLVKSKDKPVEEMYNSSAEDDGNLIPSSLFEEPITIGVCKSGKSTNEKRVDDVTIPDFGTKNDEKITTTGFETENSCVSTPMAGPDTVETSPIIKLDSEDEIGDPSSGKSPDKRVNDIEDQCQRQIIEATSSDRASIMEELPPVQCQVQAEGRIITQLIDAAAIVPPPKVAHEDSGEKDEVDVSETERCKFI